jgi:hypothetical protein
MPINTGGSGGSGSTELAVLPDGTSAGGLTGNTPGLAFEGSTNTGYLYFENGGIKNFTLLLEGRETLRLQTNAGVYQICALGALYPDSATPSNLGVGNRNWLDAHCRRLIYGGDADGTGWNHPSRGIWLYQGGWANNVGIGTDGENGNEIYLALYDQTSSIYTNAALSVKAAGRVSLLTGFPEAGGTATASVVGQTMHLHGGDSENGAAGDVLLSGGTPSGSGNPGCVYLPNTSGAPAFTPNSRTGFSAVFADPTNNKLWMYNGTGWKSVVLT